ncbi:MAG: potassium channel family protein [Muribaculaceae bacterium]|nr:potassium channel family protein [Muribaculaceae bacterium]
MNTSDRLRHFFHVVSNIRPIVWIGVYVAITPVFALIYWALPDTQFRIPDGATTDFGSWLYYSIVTITTLGFGDYTPAHGWAQAVTAIEVMCGLIFLGFFLNAVGAMKSENDVAEEVEKQQRAHYAAEKEKLRKSVPSLLHTLNVFLSYCYAVTTPGSQRGKGVTRYNPSFSFSDLADLFQPTKLPFDLSGLPAVERFVKSAQHLTLTLDSLQNRIDLTLWPEVVDDCFAFVANWQMFSATDSLTGSLSEEKMREITSAIAEFDRTESDLKKGAANPDLQPVVELYYFIKENAELALKLETTLTTAVNTDAYV